MFVVYHYVSGRTSLQWSQFFFGLSMKIDIGMYTFIFTVKGLSYINGKGFQLVLRE
jgi:hypothetical protein